MRIFRTIYLEEIDRAWVDHLTNMEHLRDGIGLRGYGQRDPKLEYKIEGYEIFVNMMAAVSGGVSQKLFRAEVRREQAEKQADQLEMERLAELQKALQGLVTRHDNPDGTEPEGPPESAEDFARALARAQRLQDERRRSLGGSNEARADSGERMASLIDEPEHEPAPPAATAVSREEPCPCGSGEPFKQCHGAFLEDDASP
jgi:preprotein translocase subunit SecA